MLGKMLCLSDADAWQRIDFLNFRTNVWYLPIGLLKEKKKIPFCFVQSLTKRGWFMSDDTMLEF